MCTSTLEIKLLGITAFQYLILFHSLLTLPIALQLWAHRIAMYAYVDFVFYIVL